MTKAGYAYEKGQGTEKNMKTAVEYYSRACKQGNAAAQANLGALYYNGKGVKKDHKVAAELLTLAANQGHAGAQRKYVTAGPEGFETEF